MMNVNRVTNPLTDSITDLFNSGLQTIGSLGGRAVAFFQQIPSYMQNNSSAAIPVIFVSNIAFLTLTNYLANQINNSFESQEKTLDADKKVFKDLLVNVFAVGAPILAGNIILSKATQYPLSNLILSAITVTAIAARYLLSSKVSLKPSSDEIDEEIVEDAEADTIAEDEEAKAEENKKIAEADAIKAIEIAEADAIKAIETAQAEAEEAKKLAEGQAKAEEAKKLAEGQAKAESEED